MIKHTISESWFGEFWNYDNAGLKIINRYTFVQVKTDESGMAAAAAARAGAAAAHTYVLCSGGWDTERS